LKEEEEGIFCRNCENAPAVRRGSQIVCSGCGRVLVTFGKNEPPPVVLSQLACT